MRLKANLAQQFGLITIFPWSKSAQSRHRTRKGPPQNTTGYRVSQISSLSVLSADPCSVMNIVKMRRRGGVEAVCCHQVPVGRMQKSRNIGHVGHGNFKQYHRTHSPKEKRNLSV